MIGLSGWSFLWILDNRYKFEILGFSLDNADLMFSVIILCVTDLFKVHSISLLYCSVGSINRGL